MYPLRLKTRINQDDHYGKLMRLCIKGCQARKKKKQFESYQIPREMNSVDNRTAHLLFGQLNLMLFFLN